MQLFEVGGHVIRYDHDATTVVYRSITRGGASECSCSGCDNFACIRTQAYPPEFIRILSVLGIDPLKEDEAFEYGRDDQGLHIYGGWFHFVGEVVQLGQRVDLDGFQFWFDPFEQVPQNDLFEPGPVSAIEFLTHLPWVSDQPEPDDHQPVPLGFWKRIGKRLLLIR